MFQGFFFWLGEVGVLLFEMRSMLAVVIVGSAARG